MAVPHPPNPFPRHATLRSLRVGTRLHRIHDQAYVANGFNPGRGQLSRFAPIHDAARNIIPTLYSATTYECAAFEYVFHDIIHDQPVKTVPLNRIQTLCHSELGIRESLSMVQLFEADLNAWGTTRAEIAASLPEDYAQTARWAEAIHLAQPEAHGLVWTSRRCDPELCFLFFGDRVAPATMDILGTSRIAADDSKLGELHAFAARAGIAITL